MAYSQDEIKQKASDLINAGAAKEDVIKFINQAQAEASKPSADQAEKAPAPEFVRSMGPSGMYGYAKQAPEEIPFVLSKETSDAIRDKIDEWQNAKTADERIDLVKQWGKDIGSLASAQGVKAALPAVGSRFGLPGRVAGGMAGEVLGNVIGGQPTTGGGVLAAGVRSIANPQVQQSAINALKFIGGDAAAAQLRSIVDQGQIADARTMANVARNGTLAALATKEAPRSAKAEAEIGRQMREKPLADALQEAHDLKLTLDPTKFEQTGGPATKAAGYVAGQSEIQRAASKMNQPVVDKLMADYGQIAQNAPIIPVNFDLRRIQEAAPYRALSAVSKKAGDMVEQWKKDVGEVTDIARSLRDAKDNQQRISFRDALKEAQAKEEKTFAGLTKIADNAGQPELIPQLKEARIRTAELHTIEKGFNKGIGQGFDSLMLGELYDAGVPLRGPMLTIGRLASQSGKGAMPEVFGDPYKMGGPGALGYAMNVATLGAPVVAKQALLSRFMQSQALPKYGTGEMSIPANITQFAIRGQ